MRPLLVDGGAEVLPGPSARIPKHKAGGSECGQTMIVSVGVVGGGCLWWGFQAGGSSSKNTPPGLSWK